METADENSDRVADYDARYDTARGRWIGETAFALFREMLNPGYGFVERSFA